jgi:hypothetical protein
MIARYWLLGGMCGAVDVREKKHSANTGRCMLGTIRF